MKTYQKFFLILIICLAAALRFYNLGGNPPSLNWDEASIGYNAYSILKTGRDEFGEKLPLAFRSFGDYKPPVYFYLDVPAIAFFGLSEFAVRFPSALLGTLTVLMVYFLVKELFGNWRLSFVTSLLLAISPWHLQFSRGAFEANIALFFIILGTWFFFKGRKNAWFFILSVLAFVLALYSYHAARVFVPLLGIGLLVFAFEKKWFFKKEVILAIFLGFILVLPIFTFIIGGEATRRFKGTSLFEEQTPILARSKIQLDDDLASGFSFGRFIHNRRLVYGLFMIKNYLSHFEPNFLFITADAARHHAPQVGLLYWIEFPLLILGIYFLIKDRPRFCQIIFWWLLVAPVAAAPTRETPHAIRSFFLLPSLQIFIAYGILRTYEILKENKRRIFLILIFTFYILHFTFYLHMYHVHMPLEYSKFWQYGYKEWVKFVVANKEKFDRVVISQSLEQPQIFLLFYGKIDPQKYLEAGGTKMLDFGPDKYKFDKFEFGKIPNDRRQEMVGKVLYIGAPSEFATTEGKPVHIKALNGEEVVRISESF